VYICCLTPLPHHIAFACTMNMSCRISDLSKSRRESRQAVAGLPHLFVQTALTPAMHKLAVITMALTHREKLISDLQSVLLFRCVSAMFYRMSCLFLSIPKSYTRQEIDAGFVKQIKKNDYGGTSYDQGNLSLFVGKRSHSS